MPVHGHPASPGSWTYAAGDDHTCVVKSNTDAMCWGSNSRGQLGINVEGGVPTVPTTVVGTVEPWRLHPDQRWRRSTPARCGRTAQMDCWGDFGDGGAHELPGSASAACHPAVEVAAGGRHTCVRHADGTVGCFGANARGQLGRGTTSSWSNQIQPVLGLTGVTSLDADENSTCATTSANTSKCWGDDTWGQLHQIRLNQTSKPVVWG